MARSVSRWNHTQKNQAARARPSYALLSFAFTFCGSLPVNSLGVPITRKSILVRPHQRHTIKLYCVICRSAHKVSLSVHTVVCLWWRRRESHPRLFAFIVGCQRLCIIYIKCYVKSQEIFSRSCLARRCSAGDIP